MITVVRAVIENCLYWGELLIVGVMIAITVFAVRNCIEDALEQYQKKKQ